MRPTLVCILAFFVFAIVTTSPGLKASSPAVPELLTPPMTGNNSPFRYIVTSNSTGDSYGPPWQAFDQNKDTVFHSGGGQQNDLWIAMDLGMQQVATNIKIYSRDQIVYQLDTPSQVTVSYSSDGITWTVAKTISGIPQPTSVGALFFNEDVNFEARHVKFAFVNARPNQRGCQVIGEIELYGINRPPAAPTLAMEILDANKNVMQAGNDGAVLMLPNTVFYIRLHAYSEIGVGILQSQVNILTDNEVEPSYEQIGWWEFGFNNAGLSSGRRTVVHDFGPYNIGTKLGYHMTSANVNTEESGPFTWNANGWASVGSWGSPPTNCPYPYVVETPPPPPPSAPPSTPQNLKATAISPDTISLSWTAVPENGATYELERRAITGNTFVKVADIPAGATTYFNTGLAASTTFIYRIRAKLAMLPSGYSNEASATTLEETGADPTLALEILDASKNVLPPQEDGAVLMLPSTVFYIRLRAYSEIGIGMLYSRVNILTDNDVEPSHEQLGWWEPGFNNAGPGSGRTTVIHDFGPYNIGTKLGYHMTSAHVQNDNSGPFQWENGNGWATVTSWGSPPTACPYPYVIATMPPPPHSTPQNLTATALSSDSIKLDWMAVEDEGAAYELKRRTESGNYVHRATFFYGETTFVDTGLAAATTYTYRIIAVSDPRPSSPFSNEATATTFLPAGFAAWASLYGFDPNNPYAIVAGTTNYEKFLQWLKSSAFGGQVPGFEIFSPAK